TAPSDSSVEQFSVLSSCHSRSNTLAQKSMARRNCFANTSLVVLKRTPRFSGPCLRSSERRLHGGKSALQLAAGSAASRPGSNSHKRMERPATLQKYRVHRYLTFGKIPVRRRVITLGEGLAPSPALYR